MLILSVITIVYSAVLRSWYKMDMEIAPLFRNIVYNDDVDKAVADIKKVVMKELEKRNK